VLQSQGRYEEAELMNRRALEGSERELGVNHPDTLTSVYNLAFLLASLQRYEPAAELYQRACNGYEIALGRDHPTTLACRRRYSCLVEEHSGS
jgi:tetratricopeptide (TPR) repeat protein